MVGEQVKEPQILPPVMQGPPYPCGVDVWTGKPASGPWLSGWRSKGLVLVAAVFGIVAIIGGFAAWVMRSIF